jgi:hypothetical protein
MKSKPSRILKWGDLGPGLALMQVAILAGYGRRGTDRPDKAIRDIFPAPRRKPQRIDNLPDPDVLAQEIVEDLEAALEQFREIAVDLGQPGSGIDKDN